MNGWNAVDLNRLRHAMRLRDKQICEFETFKRGNGFHSFVEPVKVEPVALPASEQLYCEWPRK